MIANERPRRLAARDDLVRAAIGGDAAALEELLRELWPHAYRIAWTVLRNSVAAEDAAQDACAKIAASIPTLRAADAFATWFYRIVVRAALRYRATPLETPHDERIVPHDTIADRLDIGAQLGRLRPELRLTIILRYYFDCTSTEIGAILGIPAATVRFRLAQARQRLRTALTLPEDLR